MATYRPLAAWASCPPRSRRRRSMVMTSAFDSNATRLTCRLSRVADDEGGTSELGELGGELGDAPRSSYGCDDRSENACSSASLSSFALPNLSLGSLARQRSRISSTAGGTRASALGRWGLRALWLCRTMAGGPQNGGRP